MLKIGQPVAIAGTVHTGVVVRHNVVDEGQAIEHLVRYENHDKEVTERYFREDQLVAGEEPAADDKKGA